MGFNLNFIVVFGCLLCVQIQRTYTCKYYEKECGSTCCSASEYCEKSQGKCYIDSSMAFCSDGWSYCYKPESILNTCCPAGSTCCGRSLCCLEGSKCRNGNCEFSKSSLSISVSWFYFLAIIPLGCLGAICGKICRLRNQKSEQQDPPTCNAVMSMPQMPASLSGTLPVEKPHTHGVQISTAHRVPKPPAYGDVRF